LTSDVTNRYTPFEVINLARTVSELVRISPDSKRILDEIARDEGLPMISVLDAAIASYEREVLFRKANAAYLRGRLDPDQRREEMEEQKLLDNTLLDGLEEY
jgi:hypothetical protein